MIMIRPLACAVLALAFVSPSQAAAPPVAAPGIGDLARVQRHLHAIVSMTATFSQADRSGKVLTGTLTLKKPGRIRFQYQKGVPYLIVGDGRALWFLDYSVRQKSRYPIANSPLGVLTQGGDISGVAKILPSAEAQTVSVEVRDGKHPEYGRLTLVFQRDAAAPEHLALRGWVALDAQNNQTTIRLTNTRYNVPVDDRMFRWTDPARRAR